MSPEVSRESLDAIVRGEAGLVLASLIASFGDFELAEDAFQDAVTAALERWPRDGPPQSPAAWLTVVARRRVLDRLRHQGMRRDKAVALQAPAATSAPTRMAPRRESWKSESLYIITSLPRSVADQPYLGGESRKDAERPGSRSHAERGNECVHDPLTT